jgi:ribonuclease P protein component
VRLAGTRIRVDDFDVRVLLTDRRESRVGFVVPKYKHSAVDRNRLKRRLRELVRLRLLPQCRERTTVGRNADVVVRALPSAYRIGMAELMTRVDRMAALLRQRVSERVE